jgi:DNA (cytosine-5)-methyltransferase 1
MAFELEGFCVVRGPDLLWGGDVHRFHPPAGKFDGVIGGPPCQAFSRLRHMVKANGFSTAPNLIPEYERVVSEAAPAWFLMENVEDAPEPVVPGYLVRSVLVNNRDFGAEQSRERRFSFGTPGGLRLDRHVAMEALSAPRSAAWAPAVCASDGGRHTPVKIGGSGKPKRMGAALLQDNSSRTFGEALRLQGLPPDFLEHAPFTYSGKRRVVGNGVPLPMGRAIARAVKAAIESRAVSA